MERLVLICGTKSLTSPTENVEVLFRTRNRPRHSNHVNDIKIRVEFQSSIEQNCSMKKKIEVKIIKQTYKLECVFSTNSQYLKQKNKKQINKQQQKNKEKTVKISLSSLIAFVLKAIYINVNCAGKFEC